MAGPSKVKKHQKSERDLEGYYGAVRISAVVGVLEHHRNLIKPSNDVIQTEAKCAGRYQRSVAKKAKVG